MDYSTTWPDGTVEKWTDAGYQKIDPGGTVVEQRPLIDRELTAFARRVAQESRTELEGQARAAYVGNKAYLLLSPPTQAQVVAQVSALTRQNNAIIRLTVADLLNG